MLARLKRTIHAAAALQRYGRHSKGVRVKPCHGHNIRIRGNKRSSRQIPVRALVEAVNSLKVLKAEIAGGRVPLKKFLSSAATSKRDHEAMPLGKVPAIIDAENNAGRRLAVQITS